MRRRPKRRLATALALPCLLTGCGLLEIGPASAITETEPVSVRVRVVELGPLAPERVAYPSEAAIAEFLPGDRARLEAVVVDPEGLPLADEEVESLWLHCGSRRCQTRDRDFADPVYDQPCAELDEWTTDSPCRLGEGRSSVELDIPPLGEEGAGRDRIFFYAVLAWKGARAEDCWAARRERGVIPSNCGFVRFFGGLGPTWPRLAHAEAEGLVEATRTETIPAPVFAQQANRAPVVDRVTVELDDEALLELELELELGEELLGFVEVAPGELVRLHLVIDELEQLAQSYFVPLTPELDAFTTLPEIVFVRVATAGPITWLDPPETDELRLAAAPVVLQVASDATPGAARVILAAYDNRGAERLVWVELQVR